MSAESVFLIFLSVVGFSMIAYGILSLCGVRFIRKRIRDSRSNS